MSAALPRWVAWVHVLSRALGVFSAGLIVLAVVVICQMVFQRAVLGQSTIWQAEFTAFALVAATFLGAPYIQLTRGHVNVDIGPLMAGPALRRWLFLGGHALALAFCALFLYAAVPWWLEAWEAGSTTPSMWRAPLWKVYAAVPIGLAALCLQLTADLYSVLARLQQPFGLAPDERL